VQLKAAKVYRDPIHDIISYEREGDFGRLMVTLIDAPEFQRLRFVRQVGLASLVFHGAEHSRFSHSMGVAAVARRMFDQIHPEATRTDEVRVSTVVAALLHDIGHGPFSHAMERVFGFQHEAYSRALITDPSSQVCRILRTFDATLPARVAGYVLPDPEGEGVLSPASRHTLDIVSSQLDADRFDYLLRDSYMTGVEVGRYDLERILLMLQHDEQGLLVNVRAYESIEGYLIARYHMYRLVYFHKVVRAAEAMLRMMFERARTLMTAGQGEDLLDPASPLGRLMVGETLSPSEFGQISEIEAWAQIRAWSRHSDRVLRTLARGLVERRLFRAVEPDVSDESRLARVEEAEQRLRERLEPDQQYAFVVDVAHDEPYRPYLPGARATKRSIRIRDRDGRIFAIEEKSPRGETLARASYRLRRWCYHDEVAEVVRDVAGDLLP
jgi:uncharacterized protein